MPSIKQESRRSREPSTVEKVRRLVDDRKVLLDLWRFLYRNGHSTQAEIQSAKTEYGSRYNNRGNISNYLGELQDAGVVGVKADTRPKEYFVREEFYPSPERIVETEVETEVETKEVPRYTTFRGWLDAHIELLAILVYGAVFSGVLLGYEILVVPIGTWPETLFAGFFLGLLSALGVGVKEVHR